MRRARTLSLLPMPRNRPLLKLNLADKFWTKVATGNIEDCWEWQGSCNNSGYGTAWRNKKCYVAHRVAAVLAGIITELAAPRKKSAKTFVLHKCDNRKCCNPFHFFLGSYSDNQKDAYSKQRRMQSKGANNIQAKLTAEQAQQIRDLYRQGIYFQTDLAKRYRVSQSAISLIIRNETYK